MAFTTLNFILFFSTVCLVYYLLPTALRKYLLLAASYFFYMFAEPTFGLLLFAGTLVSWLTALAAERQAFGKRRLWIAIGVIYTLGVLFFFKYAQFFCVSIMSIFGIEYTPTWNIALPLGISLFQFCRNRISL